MFFFTPLDEKALITGVFAVFFVKSYDADHSVLCAGWSAFCVYGVFGTDYHPTMLCIGIAIHFPKWYRFRQKAFLPLNICSHFVILLFSEGGFIIC